MGGRKEEIKTEGFDIELVIEAADARQQHQLRDWRKLYEHLSKPVRAGEQSSKQERIQRSTLALRQSDGKQFYFVGNSVSYNRLRINKRLCSFRVM